MIDHTRHIGIFNASNTAITLIGAGGIGAMTGIALAKMGVEAIHIIDGDTVDDVNIATQFHRYSDIGTPKAEALVNAIQDFANMRSQPIVGRVNRSSEVPFADIYISGVDSIASRKEIWRALAKNEVTFGWYIDARMAAEYLQVYIVPLDPSRRRWYVESLSAQSDEDIPDAPCTSKATIYTACLAAGVICTCVRRIITEEQKSGILTYDIIKDFVSFVEM